MQDISINFGLKELGFSVTGEGAGIKLGPLPFKFGDPLIGRVLHREDWRWLKCASR